MTEDFHLHGHPYPLRLEITRGKIHDKTGQARWFFYSQLGQFLLQGNRDADLLCQPFDHVRAQRLRGTHAQPPGSPVADSDGGIHGGLARDIQIAVNGDGRAG